MNKEEVITKFKSTLSFQDKVDIFNWYIKNEAPERYATFAQLPGREFKLSEQSIETCNSPVAKKMLEYSMIKIQEELGLINKSGLNLQMFLMGFKG
jgi:hypothetical protein